MAPCVTPADPRCLGVIEGDRDARLRDIGFHGSNERMAAALRVLMRRAP